MPRTWPPWAVTSLRAKLDNLDDLLRNGSIADPETSGWLSRMLVIRSSGFVEQTAREVCWAHVFERTGGVSRSFALSFLERSRNPSPENLLDLVGRFDLKLQDELNEILDEDDQRIRRELSFLVDRRNRIAHGLNEGVSREKALLLKDVAIEISDWLVLRFNPFR